MPEIYIGLMSGTSLDDVDAVIADLGGGATRLLHSHYQLFQPQLRDAFLALQDEGRDELHRAATLANQLSHAYLQPGVAATNACGRGGRSRRAGDPA